MRDLEEQASENRLRSGPGFNRRDFLKGSGAAVAATAMATAVVAEDEKAADAKTTSVTPAKPVAVKLDINGKTETVTVEPRVTLLDALRQDLNLTGCKDVCTSTNCGACTVIIDGKAVYSCSMPAVSVQGKKITTVEGLSAGKNVDQVISAFVKHDASQCGYCTPGFVVAVRAFLNTNPKANLEEIRNGLGGNICRCGTYHNVIQAVLDVASMPAAAPAAPKAAPAAPKAAPKAAAPKATTKPVPKAAAPKKGGK